MRVASWATRGQDSQPAPGPSPARLQAGEGCSQMFAPCEQSAMYSGCEHNVNRVRTMNIDQLLDRAKEAHGYETDSALAKALGVGRAAVSGWRHGQRLPDPVVCATLAGLTGEPLAKVIGIIGEARAISREEKAVWRKLAATAVLLAVVVFPALPSHAQAATGWVKSDPVLCIMRNVRWVFHLLGLWLHVRFGKPKGPRIEARTC